MADANNGMTTEEIGERLGIEKDDAYKLILGFVAVGAAVVSGKRPPPEGKKGAGSKEYKLVDDAIERLSSALHKLGVHSAWSEIEEALDTPELEQSVGVMVPAEGAKRVSNKVTLLDVGSNKLIVMKILRNTLALDLPQAVALVAELPAVLCEGENVNLEWAFDLAHKLEAVGALVLVEQEADVS